METHRREKEALGTYRRRLFDSAMMCGQARPTRATEIGIT
jgi:hypothetical protein